MAIPYEPLELTVGLTPVPIPFTAAANPRGFQLLVDPDNAGKLYHGGAGIGAGKRFLMPAGSSYFFDPAKMEQVGGTVYLLADTVGQKAYADPQ